MRGRAQGQAHLDKVRVRDDAFQEVESVLVQAGVDEDEDWPAQGSVTRVLPGHALTQRLPHLYALSPCNNASM